jgi:hypothetical protein
MKVRDGFVSNSSSSSFVIALKNAKREPCPTCGREYPNLMEQLYNTEGASIYANGVEEVIRSLSVDVSDDDNSDWAEYKRGTIRDVLPYQGNTEWEVFELSVDYYVEAFRNSMKQLVQAGDLVLIRGEEEL